jgi:hypothetical protein
MFEFLRKEKAVDSTVDDIINEHDQLKSEVKQLKSERRRLKDELADIKAKHRIEEAQTKHLVKMREEQLNLELQKKVIEAESEKEQRIAAVKDEYRDKMEKQLSKEAQNIKEMYNQILERLPNINAKLKGEL